MSETKLNSLSKLNQILEVLVEDRTPFVVRFRLAYSLNLEGELIPLGEFPDDGVDRRQEVIDAVKEKAPAMEHDQINLLWNNRAVTV